MAHPPSHAQALVAMLTPHARRDSIVGDLLEEYHDTQVPELGIAAADRWFTRQALGFLWTASLVPGTAVGLVLTARMLLDVAAPMSDAADRSWITTFAMMTIFVLTGLRLGLSTRRVSGAIVTALAATAIGAIVAYAAAFASMGIAEAFVHPGAEAWAALREGLDVPVPVIAFIGTVLASIGAAAGRAFPRWPFPISG